MSKCKAIAVLLSCVLGLVALVFVGHGIARARDFGVQGKQWSIDERDMLEVIEERLTDKEEEWAQIQQQRRDNAIRYAER
ncbi:MAG: hypothetical protein K0U36_06875, partial [Alphaproteobacteria bacterium]|nr:hypothetical protein [Alphaproteobacteria bacterium]